MLLKTVWVVVVVYCCLLFVTGSVVPGGGAYEVAIYSALTSTDFLSSVPGRAKFGVKVLLANVINNNNYY